MPWSRIIFRDFDWKLALASAAFGFFIGILGIFGLASEKIVQALILSSLSGLSYGFLRDRQEKRAQVGQVFSEQEHAYRQLIDYVEHHDVEKAIFFQYSGQKSMGVLEKVLAKKEVTVDLFVQDEKFAADIGSTRQVTLIRGGLETFRKRCREMPRSSTFRVYRFNAPASMRAILIDDKILCIGWYTCELKDRAGQPNPDDPVSISGHDRPTMVERRGTERFEILSNMITNLAANYRLAADKVPM